MWLALMKKNAVIVLLFSGEAEVALAQTDGTQLF
jgi:hypothetical protein|tara:strand:+ start:367 stop:468 length:102 start_codon:yes stop_codon:yes gene_type:complete